MLRSLLEGEHFGVLATLSARRAGWPFASLVAYALSAAGAPLLLLSAVLIQTGIMLIGLGLLAELVTRIYMDGRHRRIYTVAAARARKPQAWDRPHPVPVPFRPAVRQ